MLIALLLALLVVPVGCTPTDTSSDTPAESERPPARPVASVTHVPQYLAFQIFTGSPDPSRPLGESDALSTPPTKVVISRIVQEILDRIGSKGASNRRLGFVVGPLAFDHTDDELRRLIADSFEVAIEKDVAVAFHIDESMYWKKRRELWGNRSNIEWSAWDGTPSTGRKVGWIGPRLAPQMCLNSPAVQTEVRRLATQVIGREIQTGVKRLEALGKEILFAGVIAGWETQIGMDSEAGPPLGYCALTNRGWSSVKPPPDRDRELEGVVSEFIALWAKGLAAAGIPDKQIYSHTAFVPKAVFETLKKRDPSRFKGTYSEFLGFAPLTVSFGDTHRAGFSTYPHPGLWDDIYDALAQRGNPNWASVEGTALNMPMEAYLARMFNHGATLVNIFAWGIGGPALKNEQFRVATEGEASIRAYRKFLSGDALTDAGPPSRYLAAKLKQIERAVPPWVRKTGRQTQVEPLLHKMHAYLKEEKLVDAERVADEILSLIAEK